MAETPDQSACASFYGLNLQNDLPMLGATTSDPAQWAKVLDHYRSAARTMRGQPRPSTTRPPRSKPAEQPCKEGASGLFICMVAGLGIEAIALFAWVAS
ncbi:MAG: hypothetical protein CMN71_10695 [Sphingomonadaceae bacterium]|jgi:hypothetical protein|nr:hypothetical protein [Sphingomonadaceae bacterium]